MTRGEIAGAERRRSTSRVTVAAGSRTACSRRVDSSAPIRCGVAAAEGVVGERAGSALGVVDHGDLEQRAVGQDVLGELADEGDVVDHLRGDPPADVADDHRVAEAEAEEVRGVDARVEAGDHEQAQVGEDDGAVVAAGGGEGAVALERGLDVGRARLAGAGQFKPGRPADSGAGAGRGRCGCWVLMVCCLLSLGGGVSCALRLWRACLVPAPLACRRGWSSVGRAAAPAPSRRLRRRRPRRRSWRRGSHGRRPS